MPTIAQWIHVTAAVVGVGGMAFLLIILLPSVGALNPDDRARFMRTVQAKFRWVSWSVIILLFGSGLYNVGLAWEVPWGTYWKLLVLKIILSLSVFVISLCLTVPLKFLERFRARREVWLSTALGLALAVILISAYLRRGPVP